jgi:hypothetical protein
MTKGLVMVKEYKKTVNIIALLDFIGVAAVMARLQMHCTEMHAIYSQKAKANNNWQMFF